MVIGPVGYCSASQMPSGYLQTLLSTEDSETLNKDHDIMTEKENLSLTSTSYCAFNNSIHPTLKINLVLLDSLG